MQFRNLSLDEEKNFRQYARDNHWTELLGPWEILHPVCRDEWTKMGLGPEVKYRIVLHHDSDGMPDPALYLMTGTLNQAKALIEALDAMWDLHNSDEQLPSWFQPIAAKWEGCDIFALDKDGDVIFFYADGWEDFLDGGGPNDRDELDIEIPSEDEP